MLGLEPSQGRVRFEGFELDFRAGELLPTGGQNGGKTVRLAEQPLLILTMLLEHPGQVVTREEIRKRLWPNDTIVEFEHSISAAMNRLRQALGDSADNPRYIETLARRGYRLLVAVEWVGGGRGVQATEVHGQDGQARAGVAPEPRSAVADPPWPDLSLKSAAFGSRRTEEPQTLKDRSALPLRPVRRT